MNDLVVIIKSIFALALSIVFVGLMIAGAGLVTSVVWELFTYGFGLAGG